METYFIIYKTTCLVSKRYYIGMHKTKNLQDGYLGSGTMLKRSLEKYGIENHVREILEYLPDIESLVKREREIVNETLISDPSCMNLKCGGYGGGGFWNEEHRKKAQAAGGRAMIKKALSVHLDKLKNDLEYREKFCKKASENNKGEKHPFYGKHHTKEHREKMRKIMSESQKGEKHAQYGSCWITKDFENKKIKKEDLQNWLDKGWQKGRFVEKRK